MASQDFCKWQEVINEKVRPAFLTPWRDEQGEQNFKDLLSATVDGINTLKSTEDDTKCYLGKPEYMIADQEGIDEVRRNASIPEKMNSMEDVLNGVIPYFNGLYNLAHPRAMFNVVPAAGVPSIMGSFLGSMFNPNLVEQEYSGNVAALEIEATSMIAKMVGYDPMQAQGHFTFGGTGAYLFGTKLALTRCLGKESRNKGIRQDAQLIVSEAGHYAALNCTDWTGLGTDNVRRVKLNDDNSMDLEDLERVMEDCYAKGQPIAEIVATCGTTDAFGVDDIKGIREIVDRFVEKHDLDYRPFIYADAVIGWAWSVFNTYDWEKNPLEFSEKALAATKECCEKTQYLHLADGIGIDFHKTGFSCYNCTLVMVKDKSDLDLLVREHDAMAYLYQFSAYTPGTYTLECSRGGNYALAAWCNLKYFGLEGYQAILGELIEAEISLREAIAEEDRMVCLNPKDHGFVTLFRVYPEGVNAKEQYAAEWANKDAVEDLEKHNSFQIHTAASLRQLTFTENGPAMSCTSSFRVNENGDGVAALKAYPMTPFRSVSQADMKRDVVDYVLKAADMTKLD